MTALTSRLAKAAAATAAALVATTLAGAVPAHALDHYTVDQDTISFTENNAAFRGGTESFHDGNKLHALFSGTLVTTQSDWCTKISVKFVYSDSSQSLHWLDSDVSCGSLSQHVSIPSDPNKDVVRYDFQTTSAPPTGPFLFGQVHDEYVGDAPDSVGSCLQLDKDPSSTLARGAAPLFNGTASYGCRTDNGNITASVSGVLDLGPSGGTGDMDVTFTYADGTTNMVIARPDSTNGNAVSALSDGTKDVRQVTVQTTNGARGTRSFDVGSPRTTVFGDA